VCEEERRFAQEEATRHWTNAPIPPTKSYNDPAYRNRVEDSNNESHNGGRYRQTRKKLRKQFRKTRQRK
jgi:hypothetical protein